MPRLRHQEMLLQRVQSHRRRLLPCQRSTGRQVSHYTVCLLSVTSTGRQVSHVTLCLLSNSFFVNHKSHTKLHLLGVGIKIYNYNLLATEIG